MAVRTVTVELKMKTSDFEAGAAKVVGTVKVVDEAVDSLSKNSKTKLSNAFDMSKPTKQMQDFSRVIDSSLSDGESMFKSISKAIDDTKLRIKGLQAQTRTSGGSSSLFGDIKSAEKDLRSLQSVFKSIGGQSSKGFWQGFIENAQGAKFIGPLFTPTGALIAAGVAAVATPIIGGAVATAVAGGVGFGLLGAAALIQKNNPLIQAAFAPLKDDVVKVFTGATQPLVQPFADALTSIDGFVKREGPQFTKIFADLAPAVAPFVASAEKLFATILPGIDKTAQAFAKAMNNPEVAASVTQLGHSFQALFDEIGHNPTVIADGFMVINRTLAVTLAFLDGIVNAAKAVDKALHGKATPGFNVNPVTSGNVGTSKSGAPLRAAGPGFQPNPFDSENIGKLAGTPSKPDFTGDPGGKALAQIKADAAATNSLNKTLLDLNIANQNAAHSTAAWTANLLASDTQAIATEQTYQLLAAAITKSADAALIAAGNELSLKQAQADLTSSIKQNGKTFDENTQKGRNNQQALLTLLGTAEQVYENQVKNVGATAANTAAYDKNVDAAIAMAEANGGNVKQLEALRKKMEDLPLQKTITVTVKVVTEGGNQALLTSLRTGQRIASRWGGVYTAAADGLLSQAQYYPPVNPGRFMIAEPATGGEGFVPRRGDYGRSMAIIKAEAGWYGASVVEGGGRGGGAVHVVLDVPPGNAAAAAIAAVLRPYIRGSHGGDVQVALAGR